MRNLETTAQKVGFKISHEKTKLLQINNQQEGPVTVFEKSVTDVNNFVYLGSKISQTGVTDKDIKAKLKKAGQAFVMLTRAESEQQPQREVCAAYESET